MINSVSLYGLSVGVFTAIGSASTLVAIHIWKEAGLSSDLVSEVTKNRQDEFDAKTESFVVEVLKRAYAKADGQKKAEIIRNLEEVIRDIDIEDESLVKLIESYERRQRVAERVSQLENLYKRSYHSFAWLAIDTFGFALVICIFALKGVSFQFWPPQIWDAILLILTLHMAHSMYNGVATFVDANGIESSIKSEIRENN